ncbi:NEAT domain-containing protein [Lactobacillus equicursoris]|uniref:NEAT domain-containing protein n=1 Tax=Lactobacillus equicursoris TaxID=420645 RepID=UPI003993EF89
MKKKWCVVILSFLAGMLLLQTQTVKADDYTVDMTLLKTGTADKSAASSFIKQATITVNDDQVTQVAVHVNSDSQAAKAFLAMAQATTSQVVKSVSLQGVKGQKANASKDGNSFDLLFDKKTYLLKANLGVLTVDLAMNGSVFSEKADYYFAPWQEGVKKTGTSRTENNQSAAKKPQSASQSSQKTAAKKQVAKPTKKQKATTPNSLSYRVYKSDRSGLSIADGYYTHQAAVAKKGSRYLVTMTVKVKSELATFTPVNMNGQAVVNQRHYQQGGYDYWQYGFYMDNLAKKQLSGQIKMSVPIANISNQLFNVIFSFSAGQVASSSSAPAASVPAAATSESSAETANASQVETSDPVTSDAELTSSSSSPAEVSQMSKTAQALKEAKAGVRQVKATPAGTLVQQELAEYPYLPLISLLLLANLGGLGILVFYLYKRKIKKHD